MIAPPDREDEFPKKEHRFTTGCAATL